MTAEPRSNAILRNLLLAALLVGVFSLSAGLVVYLTMRGRTVEVPNVVGKSETEAAEELDNAGLRIQVRGRAHNDKLPANAVSDQSPLPGTIVKTGQFVRVSLSLGALPAPTPGG